MVFPLTPKCILGLVNIFPKWFLNHIIGSTLGKYFVNINLRYIPKNPLHKISTLTCKVLNNIHSQKATYINFIYVSIVIFSKSIEFSNKLNASLITL